MRRVGTFPAGVDPPRRVRVYRRRAHWVLQWWEPPLRMNVAERVDGDLVATVYRAREVDRRLTAFRSSGRAVSARVAHSDLVKRFLADLGRRADAGEVGLRTVARYSSALTHYQAFAGRDDVRRWWPWAAGADREFALLFGGFLAGREVATNGAARRQMAGGGPFVWDAARAMFAWAADPGRGRQLSDGFRNPFLRRAGVGPAAVARDPFGEPDITVAIAAQLLREADPYQLPLLAAYALYGLRAAEPPYLFREYLEEDWLRVPCNAALS